MNQFTAGARKTEAGKLELHDPEAFKRLLAQMPVGNLTIRVKQLKAQRTLDQNAYLHAVPFPILAEYFGLSVEETKYALMGEKFGWIPNPLGGPEIPARPSTASMTVEECTEFISWLIPWALEKWNVSLPYPNEAA